MYRLLLVILAVLPATAAAAADDIPAQYFDSGIERVALLELYTSEGCSSCPPADQWLSSLTSDPGLWQDFVPIALHVDYWNYIGWDDRFAQPRFSARQRNYVRNGAARASYTPGFFSQGREWLAWRYGKRPNGDKSPVGKLSLKLSDRSVTGRFVPTADPGHELVLNVAVLGMQIETEVRAGENKGRTLAHDFVTLDLQAIEMHRAAEGFAASIVLDSTDGVAEKLALAAWVSKRGDQMPLQAVGGYLANPL